MKVGNLQANSKSFTNSINGHFKNINNNSKENNSKFASEKKSFDFLDENNVLKNKRLRNPENLDIGKECITRNINVKYSI